MKIYEYMVIFISIACLFFIIFCIDSYFKKKDCLKDTKEFKDYKKPRCSNITIKETEDYEEEEDVYNCNRIDLDHDIVLINNEFNKLRCLEYNNTLSIDSKYNTSKSILKKLYKILYIDKKYDIHSNVIYQELMKELYSRSVYYYPVINERWKVGKIPIKSYLKNNQCLLPLLKNKIKAPLLHFDTHSDHKEFEHYTTYKKLIQNINKESLREIENITYDIACFSTYYQEYAMKNFIWIKPDWVLEDSEYRESYVKHRKNNNSDMDELVLEFYDDDIKPDSDYYIMSEGTLKEKYKKYLPHVNEDFVLSVDLDYFCTNGSSKKELELYKSFNNNDESNLDYGSHGRTRYQNEFQNPYFYFYTEDNNIANNEYKKYVNDLNHEYSFIEKRINDFYKFLKFLKNNNKQPIYIIISDSSNLLISKQSKDISITNDFCPQHIVLFIRHRLSLLFSKLYGKKIICEFP